MKKITFEHYMSFFEMSVKEIKEKFYYDLPEGKFEEIINLDPTSKVKDKTIKYMGKYSKRILNLYKNKKVDDKELNNTLTEKLDNFSGDINKIKQLSDLDSFQKEKNDVNIVRVGDWIIESDFNYETSVSRYGKHTNWCTASKKHGDTFFDNYIFERKGKLYVIRNANKPSSELYQVFIDNSMITTEFQNKRNVSGEEKSFRNFLKKHEDLSNYFYKTIGLTFVNTFDLLGREFEYVVENNIYIFKDIDLNDVGILTEIPQELQNLGEYHVAGSFDISNNNITSLKGSPTKVDGRYYCNNNKLTTLIGGPTKVGDDYYCNNNKLTSLKGSPKIIVKSFDCSNNKLTTLIGGPVDVGKNYESLGDGYFCNNNNLKTLKGAPVVIHNDFICKHNNLTSLEGAPKEVYRIFDCSSNNLKTLKGAPKKVGEFRNDDDGLSTFESYLRNIK